MDEKLKIQNRSQIEAPLASLATLRMETVGPVWL